MQSEHVFEITPKDWTHLINILYGFNSLNFIFCAKTFSTNWIEYIFDLFFLFCFQFCIRGGRRLCKIYSITLYTVEFRRGRTTYTHTTVLLPLFGVCDYFLFYFEKKGIELRWMQPKRLQLCFNFNGSHLLCRTCVAEMGVIIWISGYKDAWIEKGLQLNDYLIEIEKSEE